MTSKPVKLLDLLELAFEKPESGVVNLHLLYKLFREVIVGLKIGDQLTVTETGLDNEAGISPPRDESSLEHPIPQEPATQEITSQNDTSQNGISQKADSKNSIPQESASSIMSLEAAIDIKSTSVNEQPSSDEPTPPQSLNTLSSNTKNESITTGLITQEELTTEQSSEPLADTTYTSIGLGTEAEASLAGEPLRTDDSTNQLPAINNLLKAYLIRLKALENDVNTIKSRNLEVFEILAKILEQVDHLESRLCEEEKKVARITSDMECLSLIMSQYESKFKELYAGLDHLEIQIREIRCSIRCIEKEREQLIQNIQTVTEQMNYFSTIKADKAEVLAELSLRAYITDLKKYVPFECFRTIEVDVSKNIGLLYDEIFNQNKLNLPKFYEVQRSISTKAQSSETENIQKQLEKVQWNLQLMNDRQHSKQKTTAYSASVAYKESGRISNCLACGDHATLEERNELIPQMNRFIPSGGNRKAKEIFTIHKRSAGGSYTKVTRNETILKSTSLQNLCKGMNTAVSVKQIAGSDGCWYLADTDTNK